MIAWMKAVHILALAVWCAGLLTLPSVYVQRNGRTGDELHDLHRFARILFVNIASPAAFVAVAAGVVLIFARETFTAWMALKLAAVGALALLHVRDGFIILHLFDDAGRYAAWRCWISTATTLTIITIILWLVLAKPIFDTDALPAWLLQPGGLQSLLETMRPIP